MISRLWSTWSNAFRKSTNTVLTEPPAASNVSIHSCNRDIRSWAVERPLIVRQTGGQLFGKLYLWNEAVQSQSYYRVSIETRVRPIDWPQIWRPRVNFGLLYRRAIFFSITDISHIFVGARRNLATLEYGHSKLTPRISWTLVLESRIPFGDMHQSFTDTLIKWFSATSLCSPIVLVFFLFTALPVN